MEDRDVDELHRLWELKEKGAISEEEYSRLKSRILGQDDPTILPRASEPQTDAPLSGTEVEFRHNTFRMGTGKAVGIGCAAILLVVLLLSAIGSGGSNNSSANAVSVDENLATTDMNATDMNATDMNATDMNATVPETGDASKKIQVAEEEPGQGNLTPSQANAVRSAEQYLSMTGFSRDGLIDQLSSSAGDGYSVADATAAVDSLNVDWNENAATSARKYLDMSGFSCEGLIEQLSSSAGDKYTVEQATYGARQAGAC